MTAEIDNAFVSQFETDLHLAYQRMGSLIRNTVRTKNGIKGTDTTFQTAGRGTAGSKSRHGQVPIMNATRTPVLCTLADRYAGEWLDDLDTLKINHDERDVQVRTISYALGRDTDDTLTTAMDATTNANNVSSATTFTAASVAIAVMEDMGGADIPFDGNLFAVMPWQGWGDLLDIDEFSNSDWIGETNIWFEGVTAKKWLGFNWFPHSGLPVDGSSDTKGFFYHRSSVGHAIGKDVELDITWQGKEQAWLSVGKLSQGAVIIDHEGIIEFLYNT